MAPLFHMVEERFVGAVNPFHHVLDSLASEGMPLWMERSLDFCEMLFQLVGRKLLSERFVVVSVHRNAVVPDRGSNVDTVIQMFILFALIELEFVRLYNGSHVVASFFGVVFIIPQNLYMSVNTGI